MKKYILKRLIIAIPTIFGITVFIFVGMRIIPGDPLKYVETEGLGYVELTSEELELQRASLGLNKPYYIQYIVWIKDVIRGDFGFSFFTTEPISTIFGRRSPISIEIALIAIFFSFVVGVPLGMLCAVLRNTIFDNISRVGVTVFIAMPSFWLGMLIILFCVLVLEWRPPLKLIQIWDDLGGNLAIVLLPGFTLGIGLSAVIARITRSSALEIFHEDYIRTARAKGLYESLVVWRHVLKNSLLPVVTTLGVALGSLLGGSVSVEKAFGVPGMGNLLVAGIEARDWMMIQNLILIYGIIYTIINLVVDISYAYIDPRIRYD